jgi:hypothetical protein
MAKITENEAAAAALAVTKSPMLSASSSNVPDLDLSAPDSEDRLVLVSASHDQHRQDPESQDPRACSERVAGYAAAMTRQ